MTGYQVLPKAETIEVAVNNLRAYVRLAPVLPNREKQCAKAWNDFSMKSHKLRNLRKR